MSANDWLLIGNFGTPRAEIARIQSVDSATQVTLAAADAVSFDHSVDQPVFKIKFNQVTFQRSTTTTGTKTALSTVAIAADNVYTTYEDTVNATGYGWATPFNSQTATLRNSSDGIQPYAGYTSKSLYTLKNKVYSLVTDKERMFIDEVDVVAWLNEAYDIAVTSIISVNTEYYSYLGTLSWVASDAYADLPADTYEVVKIFYDSADGIRQVWNEVSPFSDIGNSYGGVDVVRDPQSIKTFAIIGTQIQVFPTPDEAFSASMQYIAKPSLILRKADGDEFDIPGVDPYFLTYYAAHLGKLKADNLSGAREYESKWNAAMDRLIIFQHRRTASSDGFKIDDNQLT